MNYQSCILAIAMSAAACTDSGGPSEEARQVAAYAAGTYADSAVALLGDLVAFRTVQDRGVANADNPRFRAMSAYLSERARGMGLDFSDHGAVVIVGLGTATDRLGLLTHGDVQPADSTKWDLDPFSLDTVNDPGRLVGRGVEDDKGPIAAAMFAMKALSDRGVALSRRIELILSYTEESDWTPFQDFLAGWAPPPLNVVLDSEYPVVTAEKGWNWLELGIPAQPILIDPGTPFLAAFRGGAFSSQIPEDASAVVIDPTPELTAALRETAVGDSAVRFDFATNGDSLVVSARGTAAHSSKPWEGVNAIAHLAALLENREWPRTQAALMVRLIDDLVGTGYYGALFGDVAFEHEFMGPLTLVVTTLGPNDEGDLVAGINIRSPVAPEGYNLGQRLYAAAGEWESSNGVALSRSFVTSGPYYVADAPQIPALLNIFSYYTGQRDPQPIAIGGGTHARLVPNGVNFGPAMPGEPYTGHSEHEYMTRDGFRLNLVMYTAMLVELAGARSAP